MYASRSEREDERMCVRCWEGRGEPADWTPQIAECVELVRELYLTEAVGGPLHVVVDDWNIDGVIKPYWSEEEDQHTIDLCNRIAELMNAMSVDERAAMLAYHDGFLPIPTQA